MGIPQSHLQLWRSNEMEEIDFVKTHFQGTGAVNSVVGYNIPLNGVHDSWAVHQYDR